MSDTAEYSAVATNQHGTATSKATVTVKSKSFSSSPYRLFTSHVSVCNRDFLFPHRTSRSQRVLPAWFRWGQTGAVAEGPGGGWDVFFNFWTWPVQPHRTTLIVGHVRGLMSRETTVRSCYPRPETRTNKRKFCSNHETTQQNTSRFVPEHFYTILNSAFIILYYRDISYFLKNQ